MNKKEKEIYEFVKNHNDNNKLNPFDMATFFYIGGAFPKATAKNIINVVTKLQEDYINLNKFLLKSLMEF